jgi:anti-sigma factor ChrR (cupin superfamily)
MNNHAPDQIAEQASLYVLGALNQTEARAFEEHLETGCEACEAELRPLQSVVTALGMAASGIEPPASAREELLSRIAEASLTPAPEPELNPFFTLRANEGEWRELSTGVQIKQLFVDDKKGTVTSLFKFAPGAHAPFHKHGGVEQCLILEGDFRFNDDIYGPGDFTCAMPGSIHDDAYSERGALLLIVAAAA